jgi:hypothetical protein
MSTIARLAPLRTSDRLMANPRPLAPPVITAVLSASENAGNVGRKAALCVYLAELVIPPGERRRLKVVLQFIIPSVKCSKKKALKDECSRDQQARWFHGGSARAASLAPLVQYT